MKNLLTPDELFTIGRLQLALQKIQEREQLINAACVEFNAIAPTDRALRLLPVWPVALVLNDISVILALHERAEKQMAKIVQTELEACHG